MLGLLARWCRRPEPTPPRVEPILIEAEPTAQFAVAAPEPARPPRQPARTRNSRALPIVSARTQAASLAAWLVEFPRRLDGSILARDVMHVAYPEMCLHHGWQMQPWQTVARDLRALTGTRKRYGTNREGKPCVYDVPRRLPQEVIDLVPVPLRGKAGTNAAPSPEPGHRQEAARGASSSLNARDGCHPVGPSVAHTATGPAPEGAGGEKRRAA